MVSMTSEIASLDISIPPRTHCSAAMSCGGVRSNPSPRGAISATLTPTILPLGPCPSRSYRGGIACLFYRCLPTVFSALPERSIRAVHRVVYSLCRHADCAVRSVGISLWTVRGNAGHDPFCQQERAPPGVCKRKMIADRTCTMAESYPHWEFNVEREK